MARLGLSLAELHDVAADPQALPGVRVEMVMSHLACAEQPEHPLNERQMKLFREVRLLYRGIPGSLANSSGIFLGSGAHCDMYASAFPGIDPETLPTPEKVAEAIVPLCLPACLENGKLYNFRDGKFMEFHAPT